MDRPSGPLGSATQSTGRPMAETTNSRPNPLSTVRRIPNNTRHAPSNSSLSTRTLLSAGQVVALAQEAMANAIEENQTKAAEASGVSNELKPGVTIDLSHKNIQMFPEEVVDIIKTELERLALSHNQISSFPSRFSECTSLRYLNVRSNSIREFPLSICELSSLEILDLGRNKLRTLPNELVNLTSLKVLSVQKNRIEALPYILADMVSLQVLKLDGNPIKFPPKEVLLPQGSSPPNGTMQENEFDDITVTAQIKRFLKQKQTSDRSETESGEEESSEGTETPRPMKRVMSGRFPIKVNGTDVPDLRSPAFSRPPPIPNRSHYRGLSQQNTALRNPGVVPLTIGNANERLRSNSESLAQASREKATDRSRRMGIVSKKPSELGTVDEARSNRSSHYRGLSHGSALQSNNNINGASTSQMATSPADSGKEAPGIMRRLSSLPERKRESTTPDLDVEASKGFLYALFQVHPMIQSLLGAARENANQRTSLELVVYNTTTHVEELDRHIQDFMTYSEEEDEAVPHYNDNVRRACQISIDAYVHVVNLLIDNVETLIENGEPRYLRSLLLLLHGSAFEVNNARSCLGVDDSSQPMPQLAEVSEGDESTSEIRIRDKSVTPTRDRPGTNPRTRSTTVVQHHANLRVMTEAPQSTHTNGSGRSATITSATPRSGESFASSSTSGGRFGGAFTEEDRIFERVYLRLQQASDMAVQRLPNVQKHILNTMSIPSQQVSPEKQFWQALYQRCSVTYQTAELLKARLSLIKLKEPGIRSEGAFWELCNRFGETYTDLAMAVKEAKITKLAFPVQAINDFRPLQKSVKEAIVLMQSSPWAYLLTSSSQNGLSNGLYANLSPVAQVPLPMTPQSAALGPAVQATVPSTPQSANYDPAFSRNFFDRVDHYYANSSSSRTGTMTSNLNNNINNEGSLMASASIISPPVNFNPNQPLPQFRFSNNNPAGKVTL